jgi:Tfp pilus assembly protein PilO
MSSLSIKKIRLPEWLKGSKRLRAAALLCVGLLCADLLLYAGFIVPSKASLRSWEEKYAELRKRRTDAVLFEKHKEELSGIRAGIPTQKDMPLLIKEIVQTARRLHLSVSPIKYEIPNQSGEVPAVVSFAFPVEGKYADVKRFIYEIETSSRPVGIQDLKIGGEKGGVKVQMKLMTYVKGR